MKVEYSHDAYRLAWQYLVNEGIGTWAAAEKAVKELGVDEKNVAIIELLMFSDLKGEM